MPRIKQRIVPSQPSLFNKGGNVAVLETLKGRNGSRPHLYTFGLECVIKSAGYNVVQVVNKIEDSKQPITLSSLLSVQDTYSILRSIDKRPSHTRLVLGGYGCTPFAPLTSIAHAVNVGRCDMDVRQKIEQGGLSMATGPDQVIEVGQTQRLHDGEKSTGCLGKCSFCSYGAMHSMKTISYNGFDRVFIKDALSKEQQSHTGNHFAEDTWGAFPLRPSRVNTALDGWSESTRKRVNKPVLDSEIIERLERCFVEISTTIFLKTYQIVGYPWETEQSVISDMQEFKELMHKVKIKGKGRVFMVINCTPFSPEPLTAMRRSAANIETRWRDIMIKNGNFRNEKQFTCFVQPKIGGPEMLARRVVANRVKDPDVLRAVDRCKSIDEIVKITGLGVFGKQESLYTEKQLIIPRSHL